MILYTIIVLNAWTGQTIGYKHTEMTFLDCRDHRREVIERYRENNKKVHVICYPTHKFKEGKIQWNKAWIHNI